MKPPLPAVVPCLLLPLLALAAADKSDPPAKKPIAKEVQAVLDEISVPPLPLATDDDLAFDAVAPDKMTAYAPGGDETDLRKTVKKTRALLWAVSAVQPPTALADEVGAARKNLKVDLSVLRDGYRRPVKPEVLQQQVLTDEKRAADLISMLDDALDDLRAAGAKRDAETKRWQANYDYTLARLENQIVYLLEYEFALGRVRKDDLPALAGNEVGWKLVSNPALRGDPEGKKLAREAAKLLDKLAADNPGTPWEVLAKHERQTPLGLDWQGTKGD